jgi:hypothetical protein
MSNKVVIEEMVIDGVTYVPKGSEVTNKVNTEGLEYCIVRSYGAGVFAGYVETKTAEANGMNARVLNARRLWKWDGASSLSQLAMEGVKKPENCKFPCEVSSIDLFNVVEIIPATEISFNSIKSVVVWKQ